MKEGLSVDTGFSPCEESDSVPLSVVPLIYVRRCERTAVSHHILVDLV
mgnify:CR=1 FL=1